MRDSKVGPASRYTFSVLPLFGTPRIFVLGHSICLKIPTWQIMALFFFLSSFNFSHLLILH